MTDIETASAGRWARVFLKITVAAAFLATLIGGAAALHMRAAINKAEAAIAPEPLPVLAAEIRHQDGYQIVDRFTGRLEPARESRLAFERDGLVTNVLVEEGSSVDEGVEIARLDTALLKAERDRLIADRVAVSAELDLARLAARRSKTLSEKGFGSVQKYDDARLTARALEGRLAAVDAGLLAIEIQIGKSVVRAPFAGTIGARLVDEGTVVGAGTPVVDLMETGRPQARIGLAPDAAMKLRPGQEVTLFLDARPATGWIINLRRDLTVATRTVAALIEVTSEAERRFGDTVELRLARRIEAEGFWLPLTALSEGERGVWSVLTLKPGSGGAFEVGRSVVEILHTDDGLVFARGGLPDGGLIVSAGRNRVIPGQIVQVVESSIPDSAS